MRLSYLRTSLRASRWFVRGGVGRVGFGAGLVAFLGLLSLVGSQAQGVDCERLRSQIAQLDRGGDGYARASRKQASELARMQGYAHRLGCDRGGFLFFGGSDNPQCPNINARIQQMQANLGQLQSAGGGAMRNDLVARFNAYCRGGAQPPRERGFFESLFGSPDEPRQGPLPDLQPDPDAEGGAPRGGGQAVCVRTCDGGFFPLGVTSHHPTATLNEMCAALCPGTEAAVYTRRPDSEIKTAVSLDGKPYTDLPNALKFTKTYEPSCSCRPAGKSWAEALANAEEVLGHQRKGDILVTQEKSDEMSRPKMDPKARDALLSAPGTAKVTPEEAGKLAASPPAPRDTKDVTSPDAAKRTIRRVGPQD